MTTIWVSEIALACCNRAHEITTETRSACVEVAHLLLAMTQIEGAIQAIQQRGLDVAELADLMAIRVDLLADADVEPTRPATADDLRALISEAEQFARTRGADAIEVSDLLDAAANRAAFASLLTVSTTRWTEEDRFSQLRADLAGDIAEHEDASLRHADVTANAHQQVESDTIDEARLARLEQLLAQQETMIAQFQTSLVTAQDTLTTAVHDTSLAAQASQRGRTSDSESSKIILQRLDNLQQQLSELQSNEGTEVDETLVNRIDALTLRLGHDEQIDEAARKSTRMHARKAEANSTRAPRSNQTGFQRIKRLRKRLSQRFGRQPTMSGGQRGASRAKTERNSQWSPKPNRNQSFNSVPRISREEHSASAMRTETRMPQSRHVTRDNAQPQSTKKLNGHTTVRSQSSSTTSTHEETKFYLSLTDDIVDCPSIGPKTSERFRPAHIFTVAEFLSADVEETAAMIDARHITAKVLADWQNQARLVCTIPGLRGTHAQLLVGAGYCDAAAIARDDEASVYAAVLKFANTREGQSVLRSGPPPEMEKVFNWISNAREAQPDRLVA